MNINKIAYWVCTGLMCALFLFSAQMYFFNTEMAKGFFTGMSFPTWVVIPLAIAKILGIVAVLTNKVKILTEWAYAGFFFDVILASTAHIMAGHGPQWMSIGGIFLVLASRFLLQFRYTD